MAVPVQLLDSDAVGDSVVVLPSVCDAVIETDGVGVGVGHENVMVCDVKRSVGDLLFDTDSVSVALMLPDELAVAVREAVVDSVAVRDVLSVAVVLAVSVAVALGLELRVKEVLRRQVVEREVVPLRIWVALLLSDTLSTTEIE